MLYICTSNKAKQKTNKMELTLNEILNSDLLNEIITNDDKQLEKDGWSYNEVREFAKSINKNIE